MHLTHYMQTTLLPQVIRDFRTTYNSRRKKICSEKYCAILRKKGYRIVDTQFRAIVKHIQVNNLLRYMLADSEGFYKSTSMKELDKQVASLISRENEIKRVRIALQKQLDVSLLKKSEEELKDKRLGMVKQRRK